MGEFIDQSKFPMFFESHRKECRQLIVKFGYDCVKRQEEIASNTYGS